MATPRKRYFRVADSLAHEELTNDELAFLIRLMSHLNTRWARDGLSADEAGEARLSVGAFMGLARVSRIDAALNTLGGLLEKVSLGVELEGMEPGVYFLRDGDRVKIGRTVDREARISTLLREAPSAELIGWRPTLQFTRLERDLHRRFAADRLGGEWFRWSPAIADAALEEDPDAAAARPPDARGEADGRHGRVQRSRAGFSAVLIRWEKWSQFQELRRNEQPEVGATSGRKAPSPRPASRDPRPATREEDMKAPAPPPPSAKASKSKTACPEALDDEARARIRAWAAENGIPVEQLRPAWAAFVDWARANSKRMADWEAAFRNALRKGWVLPGGGPERESPAQARVRRTIEAARQVEAAIGRDPFRAIAASAGGEVIQ